MGTATRVCVDNYEAYPGIFRVSFDSGGCSCVGCVDPSAGGAVAFVRD